MNLKTLERKIDLLKELSEISKFLQSHRLKGPLVMLETLLKKDASIMEVFINEMEEKEKRFNELVDEWKVLELLEGSGVEVGG